MGFCRKLKKVIGAGPPPKPKPKTISEKEHDSPKRPPLHRTQTEAGAVPVFTDNSNDTKGSYSSSSYWNVGGEADGTDEAFSNYISDTRTKMFSHLPASGTDTSTPPFIPTGSISTEGDSVNSKSSDYIHKSGRASTAGFTSSY